MHYLVWLDGVHVGIISGASAVWAVAARDAFFGLTNENRKAALPSIVNNVVFRLEHRQKNLATQTLAVWRPTIAKDWEARYGVTVAGFETFVVEDWFRKGALYRADNWTYLGETSGRTKTLVVGASEKRSGDLSRHLTWGNTEKKLVFARRVKGTRLSTTYTPTWQTRTLPKLEYGEVGMTQDTAECWQGNRYHK